MNDEELSRLKSIDYTLDRIEELLKSINDKLEDIKWGIENKRE